MKLTPSVIQPEAVQGFSKPLTAAFMVEHITTFFPGRTVSSLFKKVNQSNSSSDTPVSLGTLQRPWCEDLSDPMMKSEELVFSGKAANVNSKGS